MGHCNAKCISQARLDGKIAVITGCNTGIGRETVKDFYIRGAKVIMACRSLDKANQTVEEIKSECSDVKDLGTLETIELDLSSMKSIKECASKLIEAENQIDLLINNAGIMTCPFSRTEDGLEMQLGTNHLGHFLFTLLLLPKIIASPAARIVIVSAVAHTNGTINFEDLNWDTRSYHPIYAYTQSKLANILFAKELTRRLNDAGITNVNTYSLHPGIIKTELQRHVDDSMFKGAHFMFSMGNVFWKNPVEGAQTTIHCAVSEDVAQESGLYYAECKPKTCSKEASDPEVARKLWVESLKLVGLPEDYDPLKKLDS